MRRWSVIAGAAGLALALLTSVVPRSTAAAAEAGLPAGRPTYVVSVMGGPVRAVWVRLATYSFLPGGRVTERLWAWNQAAAVGTNATARLKPGSGYTTAGCRRQCPVRTPAGFQKGSRGSWLGGTWRMSGGLLVVTWPRQREVWRLRDAGSLVGARLVRASGGATSGFGFGSLAGPEQGVSIPEAYAAGRLLGPYLENVYGVVTTRKTLGFHMPDYRLCASGTCMQGAAVTAPDRRTWFHSYLAGNPVVDGRKDYWNMQTGRQQVVEAPGTTCISARGGGHTSALLQVVDDAGGFAGWVGVEASLSRRAYGQAVVASYASVLPTLLPSIS